MGPEQDTGPSMESISPPFSYPIVPEWPEIMYIGTEYNHTVQMGAFRGSFWDILDNDGVIIGSTERYRGQFGPNF